MLDKKRIAESETNVRLYLAEGLLKKAQPSDEIIRILITNAKESLLVAEEVYQKKISDLCLLLLCNVLLRKCCSLEVRI
jgi:hypothetical protein